MMRPIQVTNLKRTALLLFLQLLVLPGFAHAERQGPKTSNNVSVEYATAFPDSSFLHSDPAGADDEFGAIFPCLPQHLHLAQANNVDDQDLVVSMTVSFSLDFQKCRHGRPIVLYGTMPWKASGQVRGDRPLQFNYTSDETRENLRDEEYENGIYHSDWIYHIQLQNLQAGRVEYWYRIIVEEVIPPTNSAFVAQQRSLRGSLGYSLGETRSFTFKTPPLSGTATTLALVGDLGQTKNSTRTVFEIYKATQEFSYKTVPPVSQLLISGDLSYADSNPGRWTSWLRFMEPLVRSLPMQVLPGNHEIEVCFNTTDATIIFASLTTA